jgi:DNA-directed RNA polymerase sigma subunit (sigma70/sigma32)
MNTRCSHNLFWEELRLDLDKIHITDKALAIGNCCCLIDEPWTPEEIGHIWGLTQKRIRQCEGTAWRKVQKESLSKRPKRPLFPNGSRTTEGSYCQ